MDSLYFQYIADKSTSILEQDWELGDRGMEALPYLKIPPNLVVSLQTEFKMIWAALNDHDTKFDRVALTIDRITNIIGNLNKEIQRIRSKDWRKNEQN